MKQLKEGLYDQLVTRRVRELLDAREPPGLESWTEPIEEADCPDYLARHLIGQIKHLLRSLPSEDRKRRQLELANNLLASLQQPDLDLPEQDPVDPDGLLLRALYRGPARPVPPSTPLGTANLMMNAAGEPRLGFELERELASADSVYVIVSFIQWRGWQRLKNAFHNLAGRSVPVRVLTTTYIGATDSRAIEELAKLPNVELRISLDGRRRRLHAKAWLFGRENGFSSAYIGSANLSGPALEDGIEWTVKLSEAETPHVVNRFRSAFDTLWADAEFEVFNPRDEEQCRRVRRALEAAGKSPGQRDAAPVFFDLRPHPYQQATLDRLESERLDRGHFRNLVVAPTGTGKTLVSAFDYARQPYTGRRPRLLFLAHREELLRQARDRFRHVLRDESFADLLTGSDAPASYEHLFATIQSFRSRGVLESQGVDYWEYVVLDEAHHVPAESYRETIAALRPLILLGLTATPERMDGKSILPWFDNRIADEMRLWHAVERQYLVPFDYYGVHDGTDLSGLSWSRGSYAISELEHAYLGNRRRANLVISQFQEVYGEWRQARAIGFCVSIEHARFMAQCFEQAGIPAAAITSESPQDQRVQASRLLRDREVNVLFTVDLFNEGVDIPEVDCVLFLRPTESSTVFLQQLGRGLRLDTGKTSCLVLDFIGNQRREFRFDQRFSALFGGTRQQVIREIETGITRLPGNCYFHLDKEAQKIILDNLKARLRAARARMTAELRVLSNGLQRTPSLIEFLSETGYELDDVFTKNGGWYSLLEGAGLRPQDRSDEDQFLSSRFRFLLHIDSQRWLNRIPSLLKESSERSLDALPVMERRMVEMLTFRLLRSEARQPDGDWRGGLLRLRASLAASSEFEELCTALRDRVTWHEEETPIVEDCPLFLHRRYQRDEVLVGLGLPEKVGMREGRLWIERMNTEIFFVTLDKSEKSFSPSTRYDDFAVSPTRFHWQSQSTTSEDSPTGRRYANQVSNGTRFLLFVRARREEPFVFLGPLRYVSHSGSRPMSIYWDLEHQIPAWFFEICASLRAA